MAYKTCVLCDQKIKSSHRLCVKHFKEYRQCMHEPWFKALVDLQIRQDEIDLLEGYCLPYDSKSDIYGIQSAPELLLKKDVGRPSTDWRLIERVLQIYDQSVEDVLEKKSPRIKSLRTIARELGGKVGYVTCRNILKEFRSETYGKRF